MPALAAFLIARLGRALAGLLPARQPALLVVPVRTTVRRRRPTPARPGSFRS